MHSRLLLCVACLLIASSSLAEDAFVDTKTGFAFPNKVAEFSFRGKRDYGDPRLGYGLNYWSEDGTLITVIVYDLGEKDIKDGIDSPRVQQEMKNAQEDVGQAVNLGHYRSADLIHDIGAFSPLFLRTSYRIVRTDGSERRRHLFIRGQHQNFVKVLATGPPNGQIDEKIAFFMDQLLTIMGSKK